MPKYTEKSEEDIKKEINEQFLFAKRYLDTVHERMNLQEELYRTYIDKSNYPHTAMVFDPRVFRVIETITPRMVVNEPTGSFYPREGGDMATTAILNSLLKYDWYRAEMFPKLTMFVKSMLIFGTAFGRTHWDFRETEKTRMIPKTVMGRVVWTPKNTEKIKVTEFDGPNFEVLNIYDCFPDPNSTSLDNMRWFIYRTFKTLEELKTENETRGYEFYKNLDILEEKLKGDKDENNALGRKDNIQYREHRRLMLSTSELKGEDKSNPEFTVLRRFTKDGWCDYIPEFDVLIREVENPYFHGELPIVYAVDYPYPGELYGMGEIEPVDRIQRAINAVLNQRLDNVQLTLRTMWKVKKSSGVDMHTLFSAPGNIVTTDQMDAVEPLVTPDVTGGTFVQTMNYLTSAMQNGTGVTDYTQGVQNENSVANDTATGIKLVQQEANAQFKLKIQLFSHMVIQKIANHWKDLRIQYTTEEQKLRILGSDNVQYLKKNTKFATTGLDGSEVVPGDLDTPTKMTMGKDESFAFVTLLPDDIQPSIVGDYDFIATVSTEQINDQQAMQQNYFVAMDRITNPQFVQGLMQQQKVPNYDRIAQEMFKKLNIGIEGKDMIMDMPMTSPLDQFQASQDAEGEIQGAMGQEGMDQGMQGMEEMGGMEGMTNGAAIN